ncbi:MAG: helix-turn-helix domain-containing protein [Candidatus Pacebacteria bacterium]|nr:helix-turn-helix domain-containing protein [Candidatus Paceibacterota bacterium]
MENKKFYTVKEVADILGISRVAVFRKVKNEQIKAEKIGRNFAIPKEELGFVLEKTLKEEDKKLIDKAVKKTVKDYGETLKLLGAE